MIPLSVLNDGEQGVIKKLGGNPEVRRHLADIGFTIGDTVNVITEQNGNIIVKIKEARIAVSKEMAMKIYV